eukprot:TRINITY_DN18191_c0_g1_i1.p1 TRINITY_DN18191_c0_g1~~TRINITY_DN18191_c0_g1_i1.p1  ORF type:complete len:380 (+),score=73.51 TRINITY_DN18191_c0_g1_i1:51-1190(+)
MNKKVGLCLFLFVAVFAISSLAQTNVAIAYLTATHDHGAPLGVSGYVKFAPLANGRVQVSVNISSTGLKPNSPFAIHVHNYGDLTDQNAGLSAGEHFIGIGSPIHNCPPHPNRHEGDMGNWTTNSHGHIIAVKDFDLLRLTGSHSIIGRAVVLHEKFDNCSPPVGFAGSRLGVGVIGIKEHHDLQNANTDDVTIAVAVLKQTSAANQHVCNPGCAGMVYFKQINSHKYQGIQVTARIYGLPYNTAHGFHVYTYGDLTDMDGSSVGHHWNPSGGKHGIPHETQRHWGDFGNIQSFDPLNKLNAWFEEDFSNVKKLNELVGRAIVVHETFDHGRGSGCDQNGDAGSKILVGVIGIANPGTEHLVVPNHVHINRTYVDVKCS